MRRPRHPFHPAAARAPLTCRLGWIAGPLLLAAFFVVSLWTSRLLASVYRVGDTEFARYHHAVLGILVSFDGHACGGGFLGGVSRRAWLHPVTAPPPCPQPCRAKNGPQ